MRHPLIATIVIVSFMLTACGRMDLSTKNQMTETEAMDHLTELSMEQGGYNFRGRRSRLSVTELIRLIQENAPSAQGHNAVSSQADLSGLVQMLSLIQGGATSIGGLATGMVNSSGGSSQAASSKLSSIVGVIQALLPILMVIAPQYAFILQAIVTIIPIVVSFISLFKKPTPTAWLPGIVPVTV